MNTARPWRRACRLCRLGVVLAGLSACSTAFGAEPSAESLWQQPAPPFTVVATHPVSDLSRFSSVAESPELAALPDAQQSPGLASILLPVPMAAAENPDPKRLQDLQRAGSLAARRYADLGLRAPLLQIEDGHFRGILVRDAAGAAAFYGRGLERIDGVRDLVARWAGPSKIPGALPMYLFIGEVEAFGRDLGVYPAKGAYSIAHELFHAVQLRYPPLAAQPESAPRESEWVTEGLADALAPWAVRHLAFQGDTDVRFVESLRAGNDRYAKILGLRPYDYPLDLRDVPSPALLIQPTIQGETAVRQIASYMSSAFWRFIFEEQVAEDRQWSALPALLEQPQAGSSRRDALLRWADLAARTAAPAFPRGLYDALPAFIADRVVYPDRVMRSRSGVFAHTPWTRLMFQDGCPLISLTEATTGEVATVELAIRPLAARCLRLKWNGPRDGDRGAPTATLTATPIDPTDLTLALESLHLGHHGHSEHPPRPVPAPGTDTPAPVTLSFEAFDLDPPSAMTDGELVLTFTNVAPDAVQTIPQRYRIRIQIQIRPDSIPRTPER